jgi:type I restriction enzyme S subunit
MNAYPEYKESGIGWLGKIPSHWIVAKLGRVLEGIQDGTHGSYNRVDIGYPLLSAKNVTEDGIIVPDNESLINETDYRNIIANGYPQKGDIAMCCVATIGRGCIYQLDEPQAFQRSVTFLRINRNHSNAYILYFLRSVYGQTQFSTFAKTSAQGGVYMGDLKQFNLVLPPIDEQKAIAAYLDEKTGKIDELIAEKTKQIEDLRSYRTSFITETVTRGLNPNAPLRQSGIDWLGEIPEHWNLLMLKFVADLNPSTRKQIADTDVISYLPMDLLKYGDMQPASIKFGNRTSGLNYFEGNDILMAKVTPCFENGKIAIASNLQMGCGIGSSEIFVLRCKDIYNKYLLYLLQNKELKDILVSTMQGTGGLKRISPDFLRKLKIPVPPIDEQQEIAAYLDEKTAKIDKLISELNTQLAELAEYKQAVISEAVTGKVDVRDYKSSL